MRESKTLRMLLEVLEDLKQSDSEGRRWAEDWSAAEFVEPNDIQSIVSFGESDFDHEDDLSVGSVTKDEVVPDGNGGYLIVSIDLESGRTEWRPVTTFH